MPASGVVVAIVFTLAHIGYTFSPFATTHFSLLQLFGHLFWASFMQSYFTEPAVSLAQSLCTAMAMGYISKAVQPGFLELIKWRGIYDVGMQRPPKLGI